MAKKNWIKDAIKRPGALTAAAKRRGVTVGALIAHPPKNASPRLKRQIAMAKTLRRLRKRRGRGRGLRAALR